MGIVSRLLGIWLAGRTVTSTTPLFMRLLAAVATVAVLAAMASALLALLLGGLLWFLYDQLIVYGLSQQMALLSMTGLVLIALAITVMFIQNYVTEIRALSHRVVVGHPTINRVTDGIQSVADSFIDGLLHRVKTCRHYRN